MQMRKDTQLLISFQHVTFWVVSLPGKIETYFCAPQSPSHTRWSHFCPLENSDAISIAVLRWEMNGPGPMKVQFPTLPAYKSFGRRFCNTKGLVFSPVGKGCLGEWYPKNVRMGSGMWSNFSLVAFQLWPWASPSSLQTSLLSRDDTSHHVGLL